MTSPALRIVLTLLLALLGLAFWMHKTHVRSPYGLAPGGWVQTFEDTFSGGQLNPAKWSTGFAWGTYDSNAWAASCTVPSAVKLGGGILTLRTSPNVPDTPECQRSGKTHTSAAIHTGGKFSQEYGFFEARLRMPGRLGMLGAWWLHPEDGRWPPEIDVVEVLGGRPREHRMTLHFDDPTRRGTQSTGRRSVTSDLSLDFHVYGVDWQPDHVVFYRDGIEQARLSSEDGATYQRAPFHLIVNSMVCTSAVHDWCEAPPAGTLWGQETDVEVDWVRVWKRVPEKQSGG